MNQPRVLLVGTGKAAFHLGHALVRSGALLVGVLGRSPERTAGLAADLGCPALSWSAPLPAADIRLIAVSDDAIATVAEQLPDDGTPIIHLSGTRGLDVLAPHTERGSLWPIQSLTGDQAMDLSSVPLVVDAANTTLRTRLSTWAATLSHRVLSLDADQRALVHLAAVLTSNYPVALLQEARRLLSSHAVDPDLLLPLWSTTTVRAALDPENSLTGPAARGDLGSLDLHVRQLTNDTDLRAAYVAIARLVLRNGHPEKLDRFPS